MTGSCSPELSCALSLSLCSAGDGQPSTGLQRCRVIECSPPPADSRAGLADRPPPHTPLSPNQRPPFPGGADTRAELATPGAAPPAAGPALTSACCHHTSPATSHSPHPEPELSQYLAKMEKLMDSLKAGRADWRAVRPVKTK